MTVAGIQALLAWHEEHLGKLVYDENSRTRLAYASLADLLTPTDCSGDAIRTYRHFTGLNTGATYTGNFCTHGELVTTSLSAARDHHLMLPGDPVFYRWKGWSVRPGDPFNHVNIYAGGDLVYNHGGPGRGPVRESLAANVANAQTVMVRRMIHQVVPPPAPPLPHPSGNPMHGHGCPAIISRGTGDYFGLISGPNQSHGGAYADEHAPINLIKAFLNWKYKLKLSLNGIFDQATKNAVAHFQAQYMPGTQFPGQVWYDDWAKMGSLT